MSARTIVDAVRGKAGNARFDDVTFIGLDCGHRRALGGHVFRGFVVKPEAMIGMAYDCRDGHCAQVHP